MSNEWILAKRGTPESPTLVLTEIHSGVPLENLKFLIKITLHYRQASNGFATSAERTRMNKIEECLRGILLSPNYEYVGHIIERGKMTSYFYGKTVAPQEITVKYGFLKKTIVHPESQPDPDWLFYRHDLEPTLVEKHIHWNRGLHQTFIKQGDNPALPRPVDIACIFPTRATLQAFLDEAKSLGYGHSDPALWGSPEQANDPSEDYWCELIKNTSIEPETMAHICAEIEELATKHGGEYDGWAGPLAT